jgi:glycosyltransferase involved in cell wall biosynthesis
MRILHFIATNFVGGPERQILNHVRRLLDGGHAVLVASFDEPGGLELHAEAAKLGVECCLLPAGKWRVCDVIRELRRRVETWQPHVVCVHGYKAGFYGLILKITLGTRIVAFSRGWTSENLKVLLYGTLDRIIIRFADIVVAVSRSQAMRLRNSWVPQRKIRVVENAVTIRRRNDVDRETIIDVRQELELPRNTRILLAAGRLSPEKGFEDLLEAVDHVVSQVPETHLLLAGSGPMDAELRKSAANRPCAANIHFLGFRKDMRNLFCQADVFVLSSLSEGLPNVVLEAMALGVPVAATRVGGLPEIIEDGVTGLLVPPRNGKSLAQAILRYLLDPRTAREIASRGCDSVFDRFSAERQTEKLLETYEQVIAS